MPIRVSNWPPQPIPELTPEQHAQACWDWLQANCAPSTWSAFQHSVAVRQPQVKSWGLWPVAELPET